MPEGLHEKLLRAEKVKQKLREKRGREPSLKEIAGELKISEGLLRMGLARIQHPDVPLERLYTVQDEVSTRDEEAVLDAEQEKQLRAVIRKYLPDERDYRIVCMRIFDQRTFEDRGFDFGLTRERVRQICEMAYKKLRRYIRRKSDGSLRLPGEKDL
uniref:RNA polymerase sigma-70 region 4 domain-containing protein n=1 Tax=Thermosporothrix sp. COM3 TaxID=2490863 RepID=A0A455SVR6_9CHLR|nr:hypothetical protein KTC_65210 [Thermosporothrix sp. COM3]